MYIVLRTNPHLSMYVPYIHTPVPDNSTISLIPRLALFTRLLPNVASNVQSQIGSSSKISAQANPSLSSMEGDGRQGCRLLEPCNWSGEMVTTLCLLNVHRTVRLVGVELGSITMQSAGSCVAAVCLPQTLEPANTDGAWTVSLSELSSELHASMPRSNQVKLLICSVLHEKADRGHNSHKCSLTD